MGQIICITNLKGGSGKTTTAVNLSASLAVAEKKTLLIDCDPQGNSTVGLGIDKQTVKKTLYNAMVENASVNDLIIDTELEFLKIIPSRIELFRAEIKIASKPAKEMFLDKILKEISFQYDYIIIDPPPTWGLLSINSLAAADAFIIPLPCEFYALEGLGHVLKTIYLIKNTFNQRLQMAGILLTMYDSTESLSSQIAEQVRMHLKHKVFETVINRSTLLRESAGFGRPLLCHDIKSEGAQSYLSLAGEIIRHNQP